MFLVKNGIKIASVIGVIFLLTSLSVSADDMQDRNNIRESVQDSIQQPDKRYEEERKKQTDSSNSNNADRFDQLNRTSAGSDNEINLHENTRDHSDTGY